MKRRGLMLILSAPSGTGKTTIAKQLLERELNLERSISVTTREKRLSEKEGVDYYFVSKDTYERFLKNDQFLEHNEIFGNFYGIPAIKVKEAIESGRDVLLVIDWQGAINLMAKAKEDIVSIFFLPPSLNELEARLRNRKEDSDEVIANRMAKAKTELSHFKQYDYILVNGDLEETITAVQTILKAERLKRIRNIELTDFANNLLKS
jgi:guanylate kinase